MTGADATERRGRRPGEGNARADIEEAARASFARDGFATTSIRGIAKSAGVDPALVRHYFHSKENLFASVIQLPFDAKKGLIRITGAGRDGVGREVATVVSEILMDPNRSRQVVAVIRAAATEPHGARLIREAFNDAVIAPIVQVLDTDHAETRAALASSQLVGFLMAILVLEVEPLTSLKPDEMIALLGPTLQHTLTGPLHQTQQRPRQGRPAKARTKGKPPSPRSDA